MKKTKLLVFVRKFPVISQTFIVNQLTDLLERGYSIEVLCDHKNPDNLLHQSAANTDMLGLTKESKIKMNPIHAFGNFIVCLFQLLFSSRKHKFRYLKTLNFIKYGKEAASLELFFRSLLLDPYDDQEGVILAHFGFEGKIVCDLQDCGFVTNFKVITFFHGFDIIPKNRKKDNIYYQHVFRKSVYISANTEYTKNLLIAAGADTNKIQIFHEGLYTSYFKRKHNRALPQDGKFVKILFIGRLVWYKGPDKLVKIAQLLRAHKAKFRIDVIGDGPMLKQLGDLIIESKLENEIALMGRKTQEEILLELEDSDIFLYPGRTESDGRQENQGLVIQEAQAMEIPVICSDIGGMPDGVLHEKSGYLIKEDDLDEFTNRVIELSNSQELRHQMGKAGRRHTVDTFDIANIGNKIERVLDSM